MSHFGKPSISKHCVTFDTNSFRKNLQIIATKCGHKIDTFLSYLVTFIGYKYMRKLVFCCNAVRLLELIYIRTYLCVCVCAVRCRHFSTFICPSIYLSQWVHLKYTRLYITYELLNSSKTTNSSHTPRPAGKPSNRPTNPQSLKRKSHN